MKTRILSAGILALFVSNASAALDSSQIREALPKKTESYLKEGLVAGGDREVRAGVVKDVRRATNGGFERIVVDIDAEKAPYYQAAIDSAQRRILVTVFGSPKLAIDAKKIVDQFRKSPLVARVEFFPIVEEDAWTFALHLRAAVPVEVFELSAPTRIIFDLKGGAALISELTPKAKAKAGDSGEAAKKPVRSVRTKVAPVKAKPRPISIENEFDGNGASNHSEDVPE